MAEATLDLAVVMLTLEVCCAAHDVVYSVFLRESSYMWVQSPSQMV
jgi:hypothetical protein